MNISSNASSIQANQTLLNNSAHNIANLSSEGFIPSDGKTVSAEGGTVKADLSGAADTGSMHSQTNLAKEIPNLISLENSVDVNAAAIRTQDAILGTLLDIKI